jgi:hypothetical protein
MENEEAVLMIPPKQLLADSNIRFGLKKFKIEHLAKSIKDLGGIQTPLKVEVLAEPGPNGETHRVREGHYRQAAAILAGVDCPCIEVDAVESPVDRIKFQISENQDRENLSPMDLANTFKELETLGVRRVEMRDMFQRPGGRKGNAMQPLSFSSIAMHLSFLEFPKNIQDRIHDGRIGVAGAYKLSKQPRENWGAIVEQLEADRLKAVEAEENEDAKYLESQKKEEERQVKLKQDEEATISAQKIAEEAKKVAEDALARSAEAYKEAQATKEKKAKEKAQEKFKVLETDAKIKDKIATDAKAAADKLQLKLDKDKVAAEERRRKLDEARKAAASKPAGAGEVDKAAAKVNKTGPVALNAGEMRSVVAGMALPGSFPKTRAIAQAIAQCFAGAITDNQLYSEVSWIVGERKEKPKHVAAREKSEKQAPAA